ncbi:hypothetical protein OH773_06780 [Buttiauxella sp. WJP83]|uniref:hypothetical protein n=1 Tax=Buttiauxella sp. WJP83 TaxID=2986951 RepID=UPI0022DD3C3A|nr:hypothetical protein [Buttiauxella sp. WJP83]WBM71940.1 hypothetical protein OH773_06780 [Buttiauxella sp. WJP83]
MITANSSPTREKRFKQSSDPYADEKEISIRLTREQLHDLNDIALANDCSMYYYTKNLIEMAIMFQKKEIEFERFYKFFEFVMKNREE